MTSSDRTHVLHHDLYNLFALPILIILNLLNWKYRSFSSVMSLVVSSLHYSCSFSSSPSNGTILVDNVQHFFSPKAWWDGQLFPTFWIAVLVYFVVDLAWIVAVPSCVKSPRVIATHHVLVIAYIFIPYCHPQLYGWCMGSCMLVEINTFFLILRRVILSPSMFRHLINASFYFSWFLIRVIFYPILVYFFVIEWIEYSHHIGSLWNIVLVAPIFQMALVFLNLLWTRDLIYSRFIKSKKIQDKQDDAHGL